jgi:hypothetical protein
MSHFPAAVVQVIGLVKCVSGGKQPPVQKGFRRVCLPL